MRSWIPEISVVPAENGVKKRKPEEIQPDKSKYDFQF